MKSLIVVGSVCALSACSGTIRLPGLTLQTPQNAAAQANSAPQAGAAQASSTLPTNAGKTQEQLNAEHKQAQDQRYVDALKKHTEEFVAAVRASCHNEGILQSLVGDYGKLREARSKVYNTISGMHPNHPELAASSRKQIDDVTAECVSLPKNEYRRADYKKISKLFAEKAAEYSKMKSVEVVFAGDDFERRKGFANDGSLYDNGWLTGYVVVGEGARGEVWTLTARKDFLNSGKILFDSYVPTKLVPIALPLAKR